MTFFEALEDAAATIISEMGVAAVYHSEKDATDYNIQTTKHSVANDINQDFNDRIIEDDGAIFRIFVIRDQRAKLRGKGQQSKTTIFHVLKTDIAPSIAQPGDTITVNTEKFLVL